jgi:hypothetical protein
MGKSTAAHSGMSAFHKHINLHLKSASGSNQIMKIHQTTAKPSQMPKRTYYDKRLFDNKVNKGF